MLSLVELYKEVQNLSKEESISKFGRNIIPNKSPKTFLDFLIDFIGDRLNMIILVCGVISIILGYYSSDGILDGLMNMSTLIFSGTVSCVSNMIKQNKILDLQKKSKKIYSYRVFVKNNDFPIYKQEDDLIVGDFVLVTCGQICPVDGFIIDGNNINVDTSALDGESIQISKEPITNSEDIKDINFIKKGEIINTGEALILVSAVGVNTEYGKIMVSLQEEDKKSNLEEKLEDLGGKIGYGGIIIASIVFIVNLYKCYQNKTFLFKKILNCIVSSITIVVVAVPEGLPLAVTMAFSFSSSKMVEHGVIMKNGESSEKMSSIEVIVTDKTGTLTKKGMEVGTIFNSFDLPDNLKPRNKNGSVLNSPELISIVLIWNSYYNQSKDEINKGPLEKALNTYFEKYFGLIEREHIPVKMESFNSTSKCSKVFFENGYILIKGDPEKIINECNYYHHENGVIFPINIDIRTFYRNKCQEYQMNGFRVIGCMYEYQNKKVFGGMYVIENKLREDVNETILLLKEAGIRIITCTGDNEQTATFISKQAGIVEKSETMAKGDLEYDINNIGILFRCRPDDKRNLVLKLKENGKRVAAVGDGTNDVPAMKSADIGIAVYGGTAACNEGASLIYIKDSFKINVTAVLWGRNVFKNIKNFLEFQLTVNVSAMLLTTICLIFGKDEPLNSTMMLWINLIMDSMAAVALSSENPDKNLLRKSPKDFKEILTFKNISNILIQSGIQLSIMIYIIFFEESKNFLNIQSGKQHKAFIFNTFILLQIFNQLTYKKKIFDNMIFYMIVLFTIGFQYFLMDNPTLLDIEKLTLEQWKYCIMISSCILISRLLH